MSQFFQTREEVERYMRVLTDAKFIVHDDLTVDVPEAHMHGGIKLDVRHLVKGLIPVQFRSC